MRNADKLKQFRLALGEVVLAMANGRMRGGRRRAGTWATVEKETGTNHEPAVNEHGHARYHMTFVNYMA